MRLICTESKVSLNALMVLGFFFILSWLWPIELQAAEQQPSNQQLIQQLNQAKGHDKTPIYLQIAVKNRNQDPKMTIEYGQQALEHFKAFPNQAEQVLILSNMAWSHMVVGQYEQAETLAQDAVTIADSMTEKQSLIVPLNIGGLAYWRQSRYQEALAYYFRALEVTETLKDQGGEATTLNNIGLIYIEQGDSLKAYEYFSRAKRLYQALGDKSAMSTAMNNIAGTYSAQSHYSQALEVQLEVLRLREELQDQLGIAEILLNIGITYDQIGDYSKAHDYFAKAIDIFEPAGDTRAISQTLNAIGLAYFHQENFEKADAHYQKALNYAEQTDDQAIKSNILLALTQLALARSDFSQAQNYLAQADSLVQALGLRSLQAQAHYYRAQIDLHQGYLEQALGQVQSSIEMFQQMKEKASESRSYELLSKVYVAKQDYQQALFAFRTHKSLNDEIFSQTNSDKLAQLESLYQAEKRNKQIELLERDKALQATKIQQQGFERNVWIVSLILILLFALLLYGRFSQRRVNKALSDALDTQTGLMQAVAHEFRAPLARVQLGVDMLEEEASDKAVYANINRGLKELDSLLKEILELLKMQSKQEREVAQSLILSDLVTEQIRAHQPLYPDKQIQLKLEPEATAEFKLPPKHFAWILSNLLSNAMHYSDSKVEVGYSCQKKYLRLYVDDDGAGINKPDRDKIFEPFVRLDPSRTRTTGGTGLGLAIVQRLAKLYQAQILVSTSHLGGARFLLKWPLSSEL